MFLNFTYIGKREKFTGRLLQCVFLFTEYINMQKLQMGAAAVRHKGYAPQSRVDNMGNEHYIIFKDAMKNDIKTAQPILLPSSAGTLLWRRSCLQKNMFSAPWPRFEYTERGFFFLY